jgi:hypothetical protein
MAELSSKLESLTSSKSTPPTAPPAAAQNFNIQVSTNPSCPINIFNGSGDVLEFIANFKSSAIANNWSQAKQMEIIKVYLRGPAFEWYEKLSSSDKPNMQHVFDKLTEKFVSKSTSSILFKNIKPKANESVREFAYKISDLLRRAMPRLRDEEREIELKLKLIDCVPEEKREALKLMESTMNWEQLVTVISNVMPAFTEAAPSVDMNAASAIVGRSSSHNMTNIKCHKCSGIGHYARDCPSPNNFNSNNRSRSFGPSRVNKHHRFNRSHSKGSSSHKNKFTRVNTVSLNGNKNLYRIRVVYEFLNRKQQPVMTLIDTGATNSIINYRSLSKDLKCAMDQFLNDPEKPNKLGLRQSKVKFESAFGNRHEEICPIVDLKLRIGDWCGWHPFIISKRLGKEDAILGADFLNNHNYTKVDNVFKIYISSHKFRNA